MHGHHRVDNVDRPSETFPPAEFSDGTGIFVLWIFGVPRGIDVFGCSIAGGDAGGVASGDGGSMATGIGDFGSGNETAAAGKGSMAAGCDDVSRLSVSSGDGGISSELAYTGRLILGPPYNLIASATY